MITVYGRASSSNVQAVMWGIGELGLTYERLDYGHVYGGLDSPDFRAVNPHGLVPAIKDGGLTMFESCAILRYLADRYGDAPFWPKDPVARARIDAWAEWGKTSFCSDFTVPIFWSKVRTAAIDRDEAALQTAIMKFESRLDTLSAQIRQSEYIVSGQFTLADIVVGHVLFRWFDMDIPREPNPIIEAYYDRLKSRPLYCKHVMISYDMLRAKGA